MSDPHSTSDPEASADDSGLGDIASIDAGEASGDDDPIELGSVELTTGPESSEIDTGASTDGRYPEDEP